MPITDLSDEELKSLYKPQNEQSSDLSSISDEELMNMYENKSQGQYYDLSDNSYSKNGNTLQGGIGYVPTYEEISQSLKNNEISKDQAIDLSKQRLNLDYKEANKINRDEAIRSTIGGGLIAASSIPLLNLPVTGAIGGGLAGWGEGILQHKSAKETAKDAAIGAGIGLALGKLPVLGSAIGKTKVGQAVINKAGQLSEKAISKLSDTNLGTKLLIGADKLGNILNKEYNLTKKSVKQPKITQQVIEEVTEQPKTNLNILKSNIRANKFEQSNMKDYYSVGKGKKGYKSTLADPISRDIELSQREFNKIITEISKNPEKINDDIYLNELENRIQKIIDNNPYGNEEEVARQYWEKYGKAVADAGDYNTFKINKGKVNQTIEQPAGETKLRSLPQSVLEDEVKQGKLKTSTLAQKAEKSPEVAKAIEENPPMYEAITNADTMLQAQNEISQNADKVYSDTIRKLVDENAEVTALDVEKTRQILNELQKQGRLDEATDLLALASRQGSKLGQAVQAFSLWSKTTPEGAMLYAQKLLDKYNKGVRKNLQKRLTEDELKEIGEAFQKLNESGLTGRKLEVETAKAMKKVFKVVPKTFAQKLDGYRYINMLLSGKSRIKDFLLTGKNAFDTAIDETIAGGIDAARSALSKDKTRYISANPFAGTKAWFQGAKKGFKEGLEDVRLGINTSRSGEVGRYGLPNEPTFDMPTFEGNIANKIMTAVKNPLGTGEKLLRYTMQVPDRMFFEARYASSLANQMKARGVKEPTQDMINRAVDEAKRAVFQENRPITQKMTEAAKFLDTPVNIIEDVAGLPKGTLPSVEKGLTPFVKTPTNVIAQGAEGLHGAGSGYFKLKKAIDPEAIREAELLMGRGIRGLGELGLGYAVGKNIIDNIKTNIGEKDYYANEITGLKPNSIAIGDKAISLQNMQNNLPFFSGIGLGQKGLGQAFINTGDIIAEMPALKALGDLYNINKEAKYIAQSDDADKELLKTGSRALRSLGANYLTSLIPYGGALGELRNDIDPNARELYMPDLYDENALSGLGSDLSYLGNRLINRLPFGSSTLPARYNALGEPIMVNNIQNPVARTLSEAIDFGIRNYNERPAEMKEMQRLQDYAMENNLEGKTTLKFAKPKRYIGSGKNKIKLNNKQYSELTRLYGSKVYDELQFLMNTPEYQSQDDETKIEWVKEVLKEKKKEAEEEIFDIIEQ